MTLNHINLTVTNVTEATHFFETYFGFNCIDTKGENSIAILKGANNFTLVLMKEKVNGNTSYPDNFHIGFLLNSVDEVNNTYSKLKAGGITLEREPKNLRDSFGFYFYFENILIEVTLLNTIAVAG